MAIMFEGPRPEMRMASRKRRAGAHSVMNTPPPAGATAPMIRAFPARCEEFHRRRGRARATNDPPPFADPAVESSVHLRRLDAPGTL